MKNKNFGKIIICIIISIFIALPFLAKIRPIWRTKKHIDNNRTQKQVEEYISKKLKENYSITCDLEFKNKELENHCTFWLDTCLHYKSIYNYEYTCTTESGEKYIVNYGHESLDKDAYVIYASEELYNILKNYKLNLNPEKFDSDYKSAVVNYHYDIICEESFSKDNEQANNCHYTYIPYIYILDLKENIDLDKFVELKEKLENDYGNYFKLFYMIDDSYLFNIVFDKEYEVYGTDYNNSDSDYIKFFNYGFKDRIYDYSNTKNGDLYFTYGGYDDKYKAYTFNSYKWFGR